MIYNPSNIWRSKKPNQLANVLTDIKDIKTMKIFLRDVMTEKEIFEIGARLEAAKMLTNGERYVDVSKMTNLSSRTVARISDWLKNGCKGYRVAIKLIKSHNYQITG